MSSWAALVYIVADEHANTGESLDDAARADLAKLLAAASLTNVPVAAQIDYEGTPGIWRQLSGATGQKVRLRREANSNRPEVLRDFLEFGLDACPAEHYLVMLWGHGAGPGGFFSDASKNTPASKWGHPLNPRQLAHSLQQVAQKSSRTPFDIILLKACFACTIEVALQLQGAANYLIASQSLIPSQTFWPYGELLNQLKTSVPTSEADIRSAGLGLLASLGTFYKNAANRPGKIEVPYALLDLSNAGAVAERLQTVIDQLRKEGIDPNEAATHARPGDPALIDIRRFCDNLSDQNPVLAEVAADLKNAVNQLVVDRRPRPSAFQGLSLFHHPGYGMFSPVRDSARFGLYKRSRLAKTTGWADIAYQNTTIARLAR